MVGDVAKALQARDVVANGAVGPVEVATQQVIDFFKAAATARTDRDLVNMLAVRGVSVASGSEVGVYEGKRIPRLYCDFSFPNVVSARSLAAAARVHPHDARRVDSTS